jgi:hypothetical protein
MTLYLAGAGLSKSLQRTRSVPLMMDFTRVLTEFISNDVVLNTLVAMELGDVYKRSCLDCKRLAEQIGGDVPRAPKAQRDRFAELVSSREPESIETLFERIVLKEPGNIYASSLPTYFRYAVNQVFVGIGWDLKLDVLESFLRRRFADGARTHVFISFNYDLVLDKCIELAADGLWQPRDGYGFEFPSYTIGDALSEHPGYAAEERASKELPTGTGRFRLIKPHGSLNWLVPQGRSGTAEPTEMLLPLTSDLKIRYWPATQTFNYVRRPGEWPRDVKILIAPPSPQKPAVLRQATCDEFEAIKSTDEVFVLGYSLPQTDQDQRDLVKRAVKERDAPIRRLTIVNLNECTEYFDEVQDLLEPQETRRFNDGFVDFASNEP